MAQRKYSEWHVPSIPNARDPKVQAWRITPDNDIEVASLEKTLELSSKTGIRIAPDDTKPQKMIKQIVVLYRSNFVPLVYHIR